MRAWPLPWHYAANQLSLARAGGIRLGFVAGAAGLVLLVLFGLIYGSVVSFPYGNSVKDFGSFLMSGRAATLGLNPYGTYPELLPGFDGWRYGVNLNPPIVVLVFQLLSDISPIDGLRVWYLANIAFFAIGLALLYRSFRFDRPLARIALACGFAGFWNTLDLGQVGLLLFAFSAAALALLRARRHYTAGLLIGLVVAVKPNLLVWPALLLLGGFAHAAFAALALFLILSALPLLVYGSAIYGHWLAVLPSPATAGVATNASLLGTFSRLGLPFLGVISALVLLMVLAVWAWRCRPGCTSLSEVALLGSLLASPIAWETYSLLLLPVFLARRCGWRLGMAAALLVLPAPLIMQAARSAPVWWILLGSAYGVGLLLVLAVLGEEVLRDLRRDIRRLVVRMPFLA